MSKETILFKDKSLNKAEAYYKQLHLTREQRRKVRLVSKLATHYIPISEHAMSGFAFMAIRDYQVDNKIEMTEFENMPVETKLEMFSDLLKRIRKRLLRAIVKPEQISVLDDAIKEAYNFYKNNLV
ncbi:MAG: hypothetical protein ACFFHD_08540, partial [Promethearchaeota archaeon]